MNDAKDRKLPSLLHHIFNADSRKVGFGWWVFIVASYGTFFARIMDGVVSRPVLESSDWLMCVALASGLIGGGTVADAWINKVKPPKAEEPKP